MVGGGSRGLAALRPPNRVRGSGSLGWVVVLALGRVARGFRNGLLYGFKIRAPHAAVMTLLFRRGGNPADKARGVLRMALEHGRNLGRYVLIYKAAMAALEIALHGGLYRGAQFLPPSMAPTPVTPRVRPRIAMGQIEDPRVPHSPLSPTSPSAPGLAQIMTPLPPPPPIPAAVLSAIAARKSAPLRAFAAGALGGYAVFGDPTPVNQQIVLYVFARVCMGFASSLGRTKWGEKHIDKRRAWTMFASLTWASVMGLFEWDATVLQRSMANSMVYLYKDSDWWRNWRDFVPLPAPDSGDW